MSRPSQHIRIERRWWSRWGVLFVLVLAPLAGCISAASGRLAGNLSAAMLDQDDPEIVRSGAPAYLLLLDSLLADNPDDQQLLLAGARLYGAYGGGLVASPERRRKLSAKALSYAQRAFCPDHRKVCELSRGPFEPFAAAAATIDDADVTALYVYATSWATWTQVRQDDWNAIANLPKVELLLQRIVDQQPGFEQGRAHLYLGVMRSLLPKNLGGTPEKGKAHFEAAIRYSKGRDLMAKVEYARRYARLVFDQRLHDRLLKEVLKAKPRQPGLTLTNVLAQQQAKQLLNDDYF